MPPKKDLSSPVYDMPHEKQVELLSEALLREYMHRRKYTETLRTFDDENPRGGDTISSRALMSDLMVLKPETQRVMKEEGIETIMEMLCSLRVKRRLELEELKRQASTEIPSMPVEYTTHEKKDKTNKNEEKERKKSSSRKLSHSNTSHVHGSRRMNNCDGNSDRSSNSGISNSSDSSSIRGAVCNGRRTGNSSKAEGGHVLAKEHARELMELLVGSGSCVPSSLVRQGFTFDEEMEYGLFLPKGSGLEGILVVVQAFVCALFFRGSFLDVKLHQRQCLSNALVTILCGAESNVHHICILDGSFKDSCTLTDLMRLHVRRNFRTLREVEESLDSVLVQWMEPNGPGIFCFLLSVLMSRGLKVVSSNVGRVFNDAALCSAELTRFLLCDKLPSDDVLSLLEDSTGQTACEFVSNDISTRGMTQNREDAGPPRYPVWVVQHKEGFVVAFLKKDIRRDFEQKKAMGLFASADLFLYELTAKRSDELFLTISTRSPSRSRKNEEKNLSVFANSIRSISVWSGGDIDWNGAELLF